MPKQLFFFLPSNQVNFFCDTVQRRRAPILSIALFLHLVHTHMLLRNEGLCSCEPLHGSRVRRSAGVVCCAMTDRIYNSIIYAVPSRKSCFKKLGALTVHKWGRSERPRHSLHLFLCSFLRRYGVTNSESRRLALGAPSNTAHC